MPYVYDHCDECEECEGVEGTTIKINNVLEALAGPWLL
jgi:hypothetical protein